MSKGNKEFNLEPSRYTKKQLLDIIGTLSHHATVLKSYLRCSGELYYETYADHNEVVTTLIAMEEDISNSKNSLFIITTKHKYFIQLNMCIDKLSSLQDKLELYYKEPIC